MPEPTRFFNPGDRVLIGALATSVIVRPLHGGKFYGVSHGPDGSDYKIWDWLSIGPLPKDNVSLFDPEELRYQAMQTSISGLLIRFYRFGVDVNPVYQRPYVWEAADKVALIETIFDRGSLGTFSFNKRKFQHGRASYEIVDGKQRTRCLCDYYEDRFAVRGRKYSELSSFDQSLFRDFTVTVFDTTEATEEDLLKMFLRLNRGGRPVDEEHIAEVRARLDALLAAKP